MDSKKMQEILTNRQKMIKALQMIEEISNIKTSSTIELVFQKYAELEGAVNAADYMNENGYRVPTARGQRKYNSTDIMDILEDESNYDQVDKRILFVSLGIKQQHSRYKGWMAKIVKICDGYSQVKV